VSVEQLFVDEARSVPFSGTVDPGSGTATTSDGQQLTTLYAMAVESGAPLTMEGFRRGLLPLIGWGHYIVIFSVLLFALSTAISWSYYGDRCAQYLFGAAAIIPYKLLFILMHFVGAVLSLSTVWALGDVFLAIVILPNLLALVFLAPQVREMTNSYFERKPWLKHKDGTPRQR
jgi:AGCS family alanine or glycine:cation symporter